jgi:AcrR family transcriptional regulator
LPVTYHREIGSREKVTGRMLSVEGDSGFDGPVDEVDAELDAAIAEAAIDVLAEGRQGRRTTERKLEILRAAAKGFTLAGYAATTMEDIADALGKTKGQVYYYYRSKADVFIELQRIAMLLVMARVEPIAKGSGSASSRIAAMVRAHALLIMGAQPLMRASVPSVETKLAAQSPTQQMHHNEIVSMRDDYEDLWARVIQEGVDAGEFVSVVPRSITKPILGAIIWINFWYRPSSSRINERENIADGLADFVLGGLLTKPDVDPVEPG